MSKAKPSIFERRWLPILVGLGLLVVTLFIWRTLRRQEHAYIGKLESGTIKNEVAAQMNARMQALAHIAKRWENGNRPQQGEWEYETSLDVEGLTGYQAITWIDPSLTVRWIVPAAGNEQMRGVNLGGEERSRAALEEARNKRRVTVARSLKLVRGDEGLVVYVPIFDGERFEGFIGGAFRVQTLFDSVLGQNIAPGYAVAIFDGEGEIYSRADAGRRYEKEWGQDFEVDSHGTQFRVRVWPMPETVDIEESLGDEAALCGGVICSLLSVWAIYLWRKTRRHTRQLAETINDLNKEIRSRAQVESALRESEQKYRDIFDNSLMGIYQTTLGGELLTANSAFARMLGYASPEMLLGRTMSEAVFYDEAGGRAFMYAHSDNSGAGTEVVWRRADGSPMWVNTTCHVAEDGDGQPLFFNCIARDISKLKRAENDLERFFSLSVDGLTIAGFDGYFTRVNPAFLRITGFDVEEVLTKPYINFVHPDDLPVARAAFRKLAAGESVTNVDVRFLCKNGDYRWLTWAGIPITDEGFTYAIARNVTERKQLEMLLKSSQNELEKRVKERTSKLREANAALRQGIRERERAEAEQTRLREYLTQAANEWRVTFDAVDSLMLILDHHARLLRVNKAVTDETGLSFAEAMGRSITNVGSGEPWKTASEIVLEVIESHAHHIEKSCTTGYRDWVISAIRFSRGNEKEASVLLVIRDITNLVRLQKTLQRSETMAAMGALVAGVAHEVRNPLLGISATLDALEQRYSGSEEYRPYITRLRGQLVRLQQLMLELLEYGKSYNLELQWGRVSDVIRRAVNDCLPLAEERRVQVVNEVEGYDEGILMDEGRLTQVFQNLIENAVQHSASGGTVIVGVTTTRDDGVPLVECIVKDEGSGLDAADLPRIFDPFFTRRKGGTGLGLSIVQRIVEEHRGKIVADNRPERGAAFRVIIPVAEAGAPAGEATGPRDPAHPAGRSANHDGL